MTRRPQRSSERLSSHDVASLTQRLIDAHGTPSASRSASERVLRHAYASSSIPAWTSETFRSLGIGSWAHETLLTLDPEPSLAIVERAPASDSTVRLLMRAWDGALIESVIIPGPARTTLCISSQVGCARACTFCETGRLGLTRQLSAAEMVDQVRLARHEIAAMNTHALQNVVFMGMGEPFDNLGEVLQAIRVLSCPRALGLAPKRITVSTVGVVDKLALFFAGTTAELAVSLNATTDEQRTRIMPINARFSLATLREGIIATMPKGRRVLFEYVLFDGFNDTPEDADRIADFVRGIPARVNVIPSNPGPDPELRAPDAHKLAAFVARLSSQGVTTLVRRPRGRDVGGACGQLAGSKRLTIADATR